MVVRRLVALCVLGLAACAGSPSPSATGTAVATPLPSPAASPSPTIDATPSPTAAFGWRLLSPGGEAPPAREDHTWTLAADGTIAYLFGGRDGAGRALDDLWAFDLTADRWRQVGAVGPPARFGHNAAWVDNVGLVIFAGQSATAFYNDLWAYDPAADRWRELPAGGDAPVARYGSCAAVGPDGRLWISHGFTSEGSRFADTRAYDFTTHEWTDETPAGERPVERCLHGCWWTHDGRLALYAGQTTGVPALGDLWQLTPGPRIGTNGWSEVAPGPRWPADRQLYASARWGTATVVFGGGSATGGFLDDTWLIRDSGRTTRLQGGGPAARSGAELIADAERGRLLLFGGRNAADAMHDTWELRLPPG
ncbi:MAG TPA: kelch repeat-containing protein [Candidatus Limnocylindria bacterium]|nr:kelch repeat-containing protein [Candidatus Limnocylindria bacterium]